MASDGYINNHTRLWGWRPDVMTELQTLCSDLTADSGLSPREVAVMVTAMAAARGDCLLLVGLGAEARRASATKQPRPTSSPLTLPTCRFGKRHWPAGPVSSSVIRTRQTGPMWTGYAKPGSAIERSLRPRPGSP